MHCVDLGESFPTHIFLQNLASIQPRTSPVKFARSSNAAASCAAGPRRCRSCGRPSAGRRAAGGSPRASRRRSRSAPSRGPGPGAPGFAGPATSALSVADDGIVFGCAARIAELEKCFNTNTDEYFIAKESRLRYSRDKALQNFGQAKAVSRSGRSLSLSPPGDSGAARTRSAGTLRRGAAPGAEARLRGEAVAMLALRFFYTFFSSTSI